MGANVSSLRTKGGLVDVKKLYCRKRSRKTGLNTHLIAVGNENFPRSDAV